jgi:SAM-dependent MidA family methyltransferase
MTYDPNARRDTPLARKFKQRIRREGPISVAEYMQVCLQDPEHGYYVRQQAIGRSGDFITAPEISQVFGELIGLWSAVVWQQMGSPARMNVFELGPGRGTLMRDALRAAGKVPEFFEALSVHLVESNER